MGKRFLIVGRAGGRCLDRAKCFRNGETVSNCGSCCEDRNPLALLLLNDESHGTSILKYAESSVTAMTQEASLDKECEQYMGRLGAMSALTLQIHSQALQFIESFQGESKTWSLWRPMLCEKIGLAQQEMGKLLFHKAVAQFGAKHFEEEEKLYGPDLPALFEDMSAFAKAKLFIESDSVLVPNAVAVLHLWLRDFNTAMQACKAVKPSDWPAGTGKLVLELCALTCVCDVASKFFSEDAATNDITNRMPCLD